MNTINRTSTSRHPKSSIKHHNMLQFNQFPKLKAAANTYMAEDHNQEMLFHQVPHWVTLSPNFKVPLCFPSDNSAMPTAQQCSRNINSRCWIRTTISFSLAIVIALTASGMFHLLAHHCSPHLYPPPNHFTLLQTLRKYANLLKAIFGPWSPLPLELQTEVIRPPNHMVVEV